MDPNTVIKAIKEGEPGVFESLYDHYRPEFLAWAKKKFVATPGDIEDVWQETMLDFYEGVLSGKISIIKYKLKTYLFAIGKNKLRKIYRSKPPVIWIDAVLNILIKNKQFIETNYDDVMEENKENLQKAMEKLSDRCRELLVQRYYHGKSISELKDLFQYGSVNAVSVTLFNCLKKLREFFKSKK
ncbi:MAG: sigma-70 family RNA polymerase sigma factor [Saprospiraceae bacterium]